MAHSWQEDKKSAGFHGLPKGPREGPGSPPDGGGGTANPRGENGRKSKRFRGFLGIAPTSLRDPLPARNEGAMMALPAKRNSSGLVKKPF